MAFSKLEQSFCVLEYARTSSVVTVQPQFRTEFQKAAPVFNSIKKWYAKFRDEGCICLRNRITAAVALVDRDMLIGVWNEMDYALMSAVLPNVDTLSICEMCKKTWRFSLSIGVRINMISGVVYLLQIFKMFHGFMNNPVFKQY